MMEDWDIFAENCLVLGWGLELVTAVRDAPQRWAARFVELDNSASEESCPECGCVNDDRWDLFSPAGTVGDAVLLAARRAGLA